MMQLVVEVGQPVGHAWPLNPGSTSIGRGASNDIIVPGNQISRVHCVIEPVGQDYVLTDHSTNGTLVNGKRADHPVTLKANDRIQFGEFTVRVEALPEAVASLNAPTPPYAEFGPGNAPLADPFAPPPGGTAPLQAPPAQRTATSNMIPVAAGVIGAILILALVIAIPVLLGQRNRPASATPTGVMSGTVQPLATTQPGATGQPGAAVTPVATASAPSAQPSTAVTSTGRVNTTLGLNVRPQPVASGELLYVLSDQSQVTVVGRSQAGDWYQIQCATSQPADRKCWVAASYVELSQPGTALPIVNP